MTKNEEIRKLKEGSLYSVVQILDTDEDWKKFMSLIPKDPLAQNFVPKYNNEHIRLIEEHSLHSKKKCAEILFDEWGTSGRVRPTLRTIMDIASKADMLRVMDEIARLLGESPPPRPQTGPGAPVDTSISNLIDESELQEQTTAQLPYFPSKLIDFNTKSKSNNEPTHEIKSVSGCVVPIYDEHEAARNKTTNPSEETFSVSDKPTDQIKSKSGCILPVFTKPQATPSKSTNPSEEANSASVGQSQKETTSSSGTHSQEETNRGSNTYLFCANTDSWSQEETTNPMVSRPYKETDSFSCYQESLPNIDILHQETDEKLSISSRIDPSILQNTNLIKFKHGELQDITNNFSETVHDGAQGLIGKIGEGGYGEVFVGTHPNHGLLAIKRIHLRFVQLDEAVKTFNTEVNLLSQLRHENIVPIIGFSKDGPLCIICDYIDGGSLEMKLQQRVLSEKQRINIMQGTACGLQYIHSIKLNSQSFTSSGICGNSVSKTHLLHGDVKSANILLTRELVPKLCDFGLAKQYDVTSFTVNLKGTRPYMAPEGFQGTITQKSDVYSYGIVLLELLTGLQSMVFTEQGEFDIKRYVIEAINKYGKSLPDMLDTSAGDWTKANEIYSLICKCLAFERFDRPSMDEICEILHSISQ